MMDRELSSKEQKAALRAKIALMEQEITPDEYVRSDAALSAGLMRLPGYDRAETVMLFSSFGHEPSMLCVEEDCRRRGKRMIFPRMLSGNRLECCVVQNHTSLVPGKFGILEPSQDCLIIAPDEIDLIVVPAVCYDRNGYRLGRGGGYYDRLLEKNTGETVGLCRERFVQDSVPREAHDVRVGTVVTEHTVYRQEGEK